MPARPVANDFNGAGVTEGAFKTAVAALLDYLSGLLGDDGAAGTARAALGFTSPILDRTAPGAIGGVTPAAISGTTGTFSGLMDLSAAGAGQVKFPAAQNASANANTLDDYEEGTFTPALQGETVAGTQTYSTQSGSYTKIGNRVLFGGIMQMTAKDAATSGTLLLSGLPFAIKNASDAYGALAVDHWKFDIAAGYTQLGGRADPGAATFRLSQSGDNVAPAAINDNHLLATSELFFSGHYPV